MDVCFFMSNSFLFLSLNWFIEIRTIAFGTEEIRRSRMKNIKNGSTSRPTPAWLWMEFLLMLMGIFSSFLLFSSYWLNIRDFRFILSVNNLWFFCNNYLEKQATMSDACSDSEGRGQCEWELAVDEEHLDSVSRPWGGALESCSGVTSHFDLRRGPFLSTSAPLRSLLVTKRVCEKRQSFRHRQPMFRWN